MYCIKCGKKQSDYVNFCASCGSAAQGTKSTTSAKNVAVKFNKPKKTSKQFFVAGIALVICSTLYFAVGYLGRSIDDTVDLELYKSDIDLVADYVHSRKYKHKRYQDLDGAIQRLVEGCKFEVFDACEALAKFNIYVPNNARNLPKGYEFTKLACGGGIKVSCRRIDDGVFSTLGDMGDIDDFAEKKLIFMNQPSFPEESLENVNYSTWCFVVFDVNEYGAVSAIDYVHCSDSLYESNARDVMTSAFYVPQLMNGKPI